MPDAAPLSPPPPARAAGLAARVLLAFIRGYQRTLSPLPSLFLGASCGCRFSPTCSHYAAEAVQVHGARKGAWLAFRRLARCNPLHPGGFDPVPAPPLPPSPFHHETHEMAGPGNELPAEHTEYTEKEARYSVSSVCSVGPAPIFVSFVYFMVTLSIASAG